jgi:hypothetical protein
VAASQVLDESVPSDHDRRGPISSQAAQWSKPGFERAVVSLHAIVGVLLGVVKRLRDQLVDDAHQGSGLVGGDLTRTPVGCQCALKERRGRRYVAALRDRAVDDLAVLVQGPVDVAPDTGNFHVGLVYEPPVADSVTTRPGRIDQQRREALDAPVDRDVINLDPTFGQEFFHVSIRQAITPVPADRLQDHLRWEAKASKRRSIKQRRNNTTMAHRNSPADLGPEPSTQQCCYDHVRRRQCCLHRSYELWVLAQHRCAGNWRRPCCMAAP